MSPILKWGQTKTGVYRVDANGVGALEHPLNRRVQLQKPIVLQRFKPAHDEKKHLKARFQSSRGRRQRSRRSFLRPVASDARVEHGPHAPAGAEDVQRLGEAVVVDDAGVDGEDPHQQDDVAAREHHVEHLPQKSPSQSVNAGPAGRLPWMPTSLSLFWAISLLSLSTR